LNSVEPRSTNNKPNDLVARTSSHISLIIDLLLSPSTRLHSLFFHLYQLCRPSYKISHTSEDGHVVGKRLARTLTPFPSFQIPIDLGPFHDPRHTTTTRIDSASTCLAIRPTELIQKTTVRNLSLWPGCSIADPARLDGFERPLRRWFIYDQLVRFAQYQQAFHPYLQCHSIQNISEPRRPRISNSQT
jgi:hypothetical protein